MGSWWHAWSVLLQMKSESPPFEHIIYFLLGFLQAFNLYILNIYYLINKCVSSLFEFYLSSLKIDSLCHFNVFFKNSALQDINFSGLFALCFHLPDAFARCFNLNLCISNCFCSNWILPASPFLIYLFIFLFQLICWLAGFCHQVIFFLNVCGGSTLSSCMFSNIFLFVFFL